METPGPKNQKKPPQPRKIEGQTTITRFYNKDEITTNSQIEMDSKYTTTDNKLTTNKINENLHDNTPVQRDSPVRIKPDITVKVRGKNVTDLMSLKSFLARKKSERENRQAEKHRKPADTNSGAATARIENS